MQRLSEVERLVEEIQSREKMLHVLVNNAGANWAEEIDTFPVSLDVLSCNSRSHTNTQDASFSKVVTLNLQRVFTLTQKCLPLLRAAAEAGGHTGQSWTDPARVIQVFPSQVLRDMVVLDYVIQIGSIDGLNVPVHSTYAYSSSKVRRTNSSRTSTLVY